MRRICLAEYERSEPVKLSGEQVTALRRLVPSLGVELAGGGEGGCTLVAGSHVGVVVLPGLEIEIRPKIRIDRLFFLLSYALDPKMWRDEQVVFDKNDSVLEAVAPAFVRLVSRATYRGLLHGYMPREEASAVVRGQWRVNDQIRQRAGVLFPAEIRYDEFTEDILENQLILAALERLMCLPLRSSEVRRSLREIRAAFHAVKRVEFHPARLPEITFNRLNEHYRPPVELARLILQGSSLELGHGVSRGTSLLINMNALFERFVHRGLREALNLGDTAFPSGDSRLALDQGRSICLKPDLSWWQDGRCRFVGDVKYKKTRFNAGASGDLYQLLAYTVAAQVPCGMLIYAAGEETPGFHQVAFVNKELHVKTLDLKGPPVSILMQLRHLAEEVVGLAGRTSAEVGSGSLTGKLGPSIAAVIRPEA